MKPVQVFLMAATLLSTVIAQEPEDPALLAGRKASKALLETLQPQLQSAMKAGGPAAAMQVCASMAQPMTNNLKVDHPAVVKVSRTSDQVRNPLNAPDALDARILAAYLKSGSKEDQVVKDEGCTFYYKPLFLQAVCLNCHGATLKPEVTALLQQHYPKDRATGYAEDDFRGVIKVQLDSSKL
jgi:hypothetical protein